jgi:hypothetical protein
MTNWSRFIGCDWYNSELDLTAFRWFPSSCLGTQSWKLQLPDYSHHTGAQPCPEAVTASNPTHVRTS